MKLLPFILASFFLTALASADPAAPTAEQVAAWTVFTTPAHLIATKMDGGDLVKAGAPIWVYSYADKDKVTSYVIGLYKAGTLFGNNRASMEKQTEEMAAQYKDLAKANPSKEMDKLTKTVQVQTRPDGRKVYFSVGDMNSSGGSVIAFTTIGQYSLLVQQTVKSGVQVTVDTGNGAPDPKPGETKKDLPDTFQDVESYLTGK